MSYYHGEKEGDIQLGLCNERTGPTRVLGSKTVPFIISVAILIKTHLL